MRKMFKNNEFKPKINFMNNMQSLTTKVQNLAMLLSSLKICCGNQTDDFSVKQMN